MLHMGLLTDYLYGDDSNATGSGSSGGLLTKYLKGRKGKSSSGDFSNAYSGTMEQSDYHKGGVVKKTGPAKLHKGERVLTKAQAKKYSRKRG